MDLNEMPIEALRDLARDLACLIAAGEILEKGGFEPHFHIEPFASALSVRSVRLPPLSPVDAVAAWNEFNQTFTDYFASRAATRDAPEPPTADPAVPSPPPEGQLGGAAPDLLPRGGADGGGERAGGVTEAPPAQPDPLPPTETPVGADAGGASAGEGVAAPDPARPDAPIGAVDAPQPPEDAPAPLVHAPARKVDHTSPIIQHLTTLTQKGGWTHGRDMLLMQRIAEGEDVALIADELGIEPGMVRPRKDALTGLGKGGDRTRRLFTTGEVLAALRILCADHHAFSAGG